jgi:putative ABC transport system permease protein
LFLRPVPVKKANELVRIASLHKDGTAGALPSTVIDALKADRAFQEFCGLDTSFNAAEVEGGLRQIGLAFFTGNCFDLLGLRLQLGRGISQADDRPGTEPVAVITDAFWRDAFGGRPDVLGRPIRIDDRTYTIVGVTKPGFAGLLLGFPEPIMIPLQQEPDILHRHGRPIG